MPCIQVGVSPHFTGSPKELALAVRQAIFDKSGELGERDKIPDLNQDFLVQVGVDITLPKGTYSIQMAFNPRDDEVRDEYLEAGEDAIDHFDPMPTDITSSFLNVEPEGWTGTWTATEWELAAEERLGYKCLNNVPAICEASGYHCGTCPDWKSKV